MSIVHVKVEVAVEDSVQKKTQIARADIKSMRYEVGTSDMEQVLTEIMSDLAKRCNGDPYLITRGIK